MREWHVGKGDQAAPVMDGEVARLFNWRLWRHLDFTLIVLVLFLMGTGLVFVHSATSHSPVNGDPLYYVRRQVIWVGISIVLMLVFAAMDYTIWQHWWKVIYAGNLGLLMAVFAVGRSAMGAQRWIQLGPVPLQPSELAKIFIILTLAANLTKREGRLNRWQDLIMPFVHVAIPMVLVLKQPDLGTSLAFVAILFTMLYVAQARWQHLVIIGGGGLALVIAWILAHFYLGVPIILRDYQLQRLLVFLNPGSDPHGAGYNIIQSIIAVGSGQIFGKGIGSGTQNMLDFIPEQHTDFIFSVVGEEAGFIGAAALLIVFLAVILRAINAAQRARDSYGALVASGIAGLLTFHALVNVGGVIGIMPVTGIPLPFISYGGSSMLTNGVAMGILLSIYMRRYTVY